MNSQGSIDPGGRGERKGGGPRPAQRGVSTALVWSTPTPPRPPAEETPPDLPFRRGGKFTRGGEEVLSLACPVRG
jgi:hypothetical protein